MRIVLNVILILTLVSCSQSKKENKQPRLFDNSNKIETSLEAKNTTKKDTKLKVVDSLRHFLNLTNGFNEIPEDYYEKYLNLEKPEYDNYFNVYGSLNNRYKSLENYFVLYFSIGRGGVCSYDQVATIDKKGKLITMMEIGVQCDQDQSDPVYESITNKILDSITIEVTESINEPKDKRVMNDSGFLLDSIDISDVEMIESSFRYYVKIDSLGIIEKKDNL